jgi:protein-arginine kinase activator protein McsA
MKKPSGLTSLQKQLEIAIENEDFEMAVELRDKIKKFETNQKQIEELEQELKQSIKDLNFEKSIELRDKLKELKK